MPAPDSGEQQALPVPSGGRAAVGPATWAKRCGNVGPYVWERWAGLRRRQYVAMECNRPAGHDGGEHGWSDSRQGLLFVWDRSGRPVRPLPIKEGTDA